MLTIRQIQQACAGTLLQGDPSQKIKKVRIDSRQVKKGDLFIAIKGVRHDAHRFLKDVIKKGASGVIVSKKVTAPKNVSIIRVDDTTKALGHVAACYRSQFSIPVVAITGSAGKTSTKETIAQVLGSKYKVLKNKKTENNQYGVPLTVLQLRKDHQVLVIELGTNQKGDIAWLAQITKPNVAVFTNIGEAHLQGLKNKAGVFREKFSLVKHMPSAGAIIFNADDPILREIKRKNLAQKKISYGIKQGSDFTARDIKLKNDRLQFRVKNQNVTVNSMAQHNIYNALAAFSCGALFKIPYNKISTNISKKFIQAGRFHLMRLGKMRIIDDTYNANPLSLRSAVETLSLIRMKGKKVLVCADMLELGERSASIHEQTGRWIAGKDVDHIFTFGPQARFIHKGLMKVRKTKTCFHFQTKDDLHKKLQQICRKGDIVLVKGSRSMKMEQTVDHLKGLFR